MKFIFYYEYRHIVGGVTSLYITVFEELLRRKIDFLFFNYFDGLVYTELNKKGFKVPVVDIDSFDWEKLESIVNSDDIIVLTSFDDCYYKFIKINPRVLYYNIDNSLGEISKYKFGLNLRFLGRKLIRKLDISNSLLLMDDTGLNNASKKLNYHIKNINFLPVPITNNELNYYISKSISNHVIKLSYVGRSVDWKMMPLKKILQDISKMEKNCRIVFSIVTDDLVELKNHINIKNFENENLSIKLWEKINPTELSQFLLDNSDVGFGMGTVILDYGKLGIPVIMVDASKNDFPENYKYRWGFETSYYSLGKFIDDYNGDFNGVGMNDLFHAIRYDPQFLKKKSERIFNYTNTNHGIKNFVTKLLSYSKISDFRLKDSKPYILYYYSLHQNIKKIIN